MSDPISRDVSSVDLHNRFVQSTVVAGSPAAASETTIAQVTVGENEQVETGVFLSGWAAFTVGTSGASVRMRIRRGSISGSVVGDTGALTGGVTAANLLAQDVEAIDTAPVLPGQLYTLTLTVGSGAAISTVSAVVLKATVV